MVASNGVACCLVIHIAYDSCNHPASPLYFFFYLLTWRVFPLFEFKFIALFQELVCVWFSIHAVFVSVRPTTKHFLLSLTAVHVAFQD